MTTEAIAFPVHWQAMGGTHSITMTAKLLPRADVDRLTDGAPGRAAEACRAASRSWDGVVGEDGRPLPFTPENLASVLDTPNFAIAWKVAYIIAWLPHRKQAR